MGKKHTICVRLHRRGFTLIELLVVIAIIGLLSSIIMASLSDARIKADNAARNAQVVEYVKALNFAYDPSHPGGYPGNTPGAQYCLSHYPTSQYPDNNNNCLIPDGGPFSENPSGDSSVINAIQMYLPSRPPLKPVLDSHRNVFDGPIYAYQKDSPAINFVFWYLQGKVLPGGNTDMSGVQCALGASQGGAGSFYPGVIKCRLQLQ